MNSNRSTSSDPDPSPNQAVSRRSFLAGTSVAAVSFTVLQPHLVRGATANSKINLGLIGCGGRGKWMAELFAKHGGYQVAAVADYFQDRADEAGEKLGVPAAKRFSGLNGYKKLLEAGVDAVAIESPPYFHPEQAAAAVAAGKHVYLAKPIAVDVPGCQSVEQSAGKAAANKLSFLVDFQTRAHPDYQEAVRKVHQGEIGSIISGEAVYYCDLYFQAMDAEFRKQPVTPETRLRAWAIDRVLSGDVITEQNIHALDVATWALDAAPLKACGTGGRARPYLGDCWDHFAVVYQFPKDVVLSFSSKQVGKGWDDIGCRVFGSTGTLDTHYSGKVEIRSDDPFKGDTRNLYLIGAENNIAAFHKAISSGDSSNPTVAPSVRSNLTTILGRTAAYAKREVTWAEMLANNERWTFDTSGLKG